MVHVSAVQKVFKIVDQHLFPAMVPNGEYVTFYGPTLSQELGRGSRRKRLPHYARHRGELKGAAIAPVRPGRGPAGVTRWKPNGGLRQPVSYGPAQRDPGFGDSDYSRPRGSAASEIGAGLWRLLRLSRPWTGGVVCRCRGPTSSFRSWHSFLSAVARAKTAVANITSIPLLIMPSRCRTTRGRLGSYVIVVPFRCSPCH